MSLHTVTNDCSIAFEDRGAFYSATAKGNDVANGMAAVIATSVEDIIERLKGVMLVTVPDAVWDSIKDQLLNDGYL